MARGGVKGKMKQWRKDAIKHNEDASSTLGHRVTHMGRRFKPNMWMGQVSFPSVLVMNMFNGVGLIPEEVQEPELDEVSKEVVNQIMGASA